MIKQDLILEKTYLLKYFSENNIDIKFNSIYEFLESNSTDKEQIKNILNVLNINETYTNYSSFKLMLERMSDFDKIAKISTLDVEVEIEVDLKHSSHSMERQGRSSEYIKNEDIKNAVNKATDQLVNALLKDWIDINEAVWIYDKSNDLNIVGSMSYVNTATNKYTFKVITVMISKEFYNSKKSFKIEVE